MKIKVHRDRLDELEKIYNESTEEAIFKKKCYSEEYMGAQIISKSKIDELENLEEEKYKREERRIDIRIEDYKKRYSKKIEEVDRKIKIYFNR